MADELSCACHAQLPSGFELHAEFRLPLDRARITVLFGPSGAGKTTLLRMLAGLDRPDQGAIVFRDRTWLDSTTGVWLAPQQRRAGYVAQNFALFPHLSVAGNIAYAARTGNSGEYLKMFELGELGERYPGEISSGQRQRVALARALAATPVLLLLDEPLSALDAAARARTRSQLRMLLLASGVPCLVVTHDRMEAAAIGDWIAVIANGRLRQYGPVHDVFQHPADIEVAESLGVENVLPAEIVGRHAGLVDLRTGSMQLQAIDSGEAGAVVVCIRAQDVAVARDVPQTSSMRNRLVGSVKSITVEGPLARVEIDCGIPLVATITAQSAEEMALKSGDRVWAVVKTTAVHLAGDDR